MRIVWSLESSERFIIQKWAGEAVVYDKCSGDTHVLEPIAVAVVTRLATLQLSRQDLLRKLGDQFDVPINDIDELTDATLSNLQHIGLIHTVTLETL